MKLDYPMPRQARQLVALWQEAFGDSVEFIEGFYCTGFSPSRCRCLSIDGEVAAAAYWMDLRLESRRYAYIYAVAVAKKHRGKGLSRVLMADIHSQLALRGYSGALLVPQDASLRQMYGKMGYRDCTTVAEFTALAGDAPLELKRIDRDAYCRLRRELLPSGSAVEEAESIAYLENMAFFYWGAGVLLAARRENGVLYCPEYLGDESLAPGVLAFLKCREGHFRIPGDEKPFAMFLGLEADAPVPSHLALAFD